jgi:hypothetical protein
VSYGNADGGFRLDDEIRGAMNRKGEEIDNCQDLKTRTRHIKYAFDKEGEDVEALEDLKETLGERFAEIACSGEREERESVILPLGFDPEQLRIPQEIASALANRRATRFGSAKVVFDGFAERLDWDWQRQVEVLLAFCGEDMVGPLLRQIDEFGQTEDFKKFLIGNFGDDDAVEGVPVDGAGLLEQVPWSPASVR